MRYCLTEWPFVVIYNIFYMYFCIRETPKTAASSIGQRNRFMNTASWLSQQKADEEDAELTGRSLVGCQLIREYLLSRVNLPIHQHLSHYSTLHTLQYLFYHMKCGILVSIRNNKLVVFCPFVNKEYENNWHDVLQVEGTLDSYYLRKSRFYRDEDIIEKSKW